MSSPAIQLIDAALAADLTQNELKAFLALVRQTLCFGKTSDPLTIKRLVYLTHVRKDRLATVIDSLLEKGLFNRTEHLIFDHEYHVPDQFLNGVDGAFFASSAPKIRENFRKEEAISENQIHTNTTITDINLTDKQASVPVCAVTPSAIEKPNAVNQQAFIDLLPALKKLPLAQANDVLALLNLAIQDGSIRSSQQQLGGGLIKAAKAGTLDTSALKRTQPTEVPAPIDNSHQQELMSKIRGLESLKQLAGSLDGRSEAQLATWKSELSQLQPTRA